MNKSLVLFTDSFPFGTKETFLNTEILFLSKNFEKIIIIPLRDSDLAREVPANVTVNLNFISEKPNTYKRFLITFFSSPLYKAIYSDFPYIFSLEYIKLLLTWSANITRMKNVVLNLLNKNVVDSNDTVFYTYAYTSNTIAISEIKKMYHSNLKLITRVHGGDLYEYAHGFSVFPLRKSSIQYINKIYSISKDGKKHLQLKYPEYSKIIYLSRLGVKSLGRTKNKNKNKNIINIVSCSNIIPLKRVHLILKIVNLLDFKVKWTHFGKGNSPELTSLLTTVNDNIVVDLVGQKRNEEVYQFYLENEIDIFINVSTSEGIPVSIMEAMSCGIPVIATNVGGTSEIVKDNYNGFLLDRDFLLTDAVEYIHLLINDEDRFKENAYQTWKDDYSATENYNKFIQSI